MGCQCMQCVAGVVACPSALRRGSGRLAYACRGVGVLRARWCARLARSVLGCSVTRHAPAACMCCWLGWLAHVLFPQRARTRRAVQLLGVCGGHVAAAAASSVRSQQVHLLPCRCARNPSPHRCLGICTASCSCSCCQSPQNRLAPAASQWCRGRADSLVGCSKCDAAHSVSGVPFWQREEAQ